MSNIKQDNSIKLLFDEIIKDKTHKRIMNAIIDNSSPEEVINLLVKEKKGNTND